MHSNEPRLDPFVPHLVSRCTHSAHEIGAECTRVATFTKPKSGSWHVQVRRKKSTSRTPSSDDVTLRNGRLMSSAQSIEALRSAQGAAPAALAIDFGFIRAILLHPTSSKAKHVHAAGAKHPLFYELMSWERLS